MKNGIRESGLVGEDFVEDLDDVGHQDGEVAELLNRGQELKIGPD